MDVVKTITKMIEARQEIEQLSQDIESKAKKFDVLISDLIEFLKHKRLLETRRAKLSAVTCPHSRRNPKSRDSRKRRQS